MMFLCNFASTARFLGVLLFFLVVSEIFLQQLDSICLGHTDVNNLLQFVFVLETFVDLSHYFGYQWGIVG